MDTQYAVRDSLQKSDNLPQREITRRTGLSASRFAALAGIDGSTPGNHLAGMGRFPAAVRGNIFRQIV
ncbi:hypothetical protein MOOR_24450 [Moorella thermoacetica]|uniref:Uncharacterized protein n=2 Tax=Neomoorella thermoacetica TaxID=1525 RepID=A0A1J5JR57_NEOTH|nr:hypothetical protein MOOR_24450 [Moorella thermoacetica]